MSAGLTPSPLGVHSLQDAQRNWHYQVACGNNSHELTRRAGTNDIALCTAQDSLTKKSFIETEGFTTLDMGKHIICTLGCNKTPASYHVFAMPKVPSQYGPLYQLLASKVKYIASAAFGAAIAALWYHVNARAKTGYFC